MSTAYLFGQSGGVLPQMCEQINNLRAISTSAPCLGSTDRVPVVYLTWEWPDDESCDGVRFYGKEGSIPSKIGDGESHGGLCLRGDKRTGWVNEGNFVVASDEWEGDIGKTFYYRAFAHCTNGEYQIAQRSVSVTLDGNTRLANLGGGALIRISVNGYNENFILVHQGNPDPSRYGDDCYGAWLLMQDIYTNRAWDSSGGSDYSKSSIHTYLNGTFYNQITSSVRNIIKQVNIPYDDEFVIDADKAYHVRKTVPAKVFLLDRSEIEIYDNDNENGSVLSYFDLSDSYAQINRIAYYNGTAAYWYTRWGVQDPSSIYIVKVGDNGTQYSNLNSTDSLGIRPAFILPLDTKVNPTPNSDGSYSLIL